MAELAPSDLPAAVLARFADNTAAQAAIDTALAAARRYCGWWVSPVQTGVVMDVDGPGGRVLSLPTLNLIAVTALTENGDTVDVTKLDVSRRKGNVVKQSGCWSHRYGAILATVTHGYTEAEAKDWRRAIIKVVDLRSTSSRDSGDMKRKKVNNVEYEWFETIVSVDAELSALFSPFRILPAP